MTAPLLARARALAAQLSAATRDALGEVSQPDDIAAVILLTREAVDLHAALEAIEERVSARGQRWVG